MYETIPPRRGLSIKIFYIRFSLACIPALRNLRNIFKLNSRGRSLCLWKNQLKSLPEMAASRGTIKVGSKVLDWLNEEQYRRWKKTGKEPTQNDLIREVIEIARHPEKLAIYSNEVHRLQLSEETYRCMQLLISTVESGGKDTIAAVQQNLHRIYLKQQKAVLESAQQKSELRAAVVIARFLKSGATLRWGHQGWEVSEAEKFLSHETVGQLNELGFITPEVDLERDQERPGEFIRDLLSNRGIERLDKFSRRAFRANQSRAYFEYLGELLELYQEHSTVHDVAISYPSLVREKIRFTYHFAWLYLAGMLHLFGMTEEFRLRIAQYSLHAIVRRSAI